MVSPLEELTELSAVVSAAPFEVARGDVLIIEVDSRLSVAQRDQIRAEVTRHGLDAVVLDSNCHVVGVVRAGEPATA